MLQDRKDISIVGIQITGECPATKGNILECTETKEQNSWTSHHYIRSCVFLNRSAG